MSSRPLNGIDTAPGPRAPRTSVPAGLQPVPRDPRELDITSVARSDKVIRKLVPFVAASFFVAEIVAVARLETENGCGSARAA